MSLVIFILIFLILCNWFQLRSFLSIIIGPRYKISSVDDKWIKETVKKKTGLSLLDITIFHDQKLYGMMVGLPFWPKMILSEGLYKSLNKDELEWVILHEAGHCVLWHNLQAFIIQIGILSVGIYTMLLYKLPLLLTWLYAIFLSFVCIQILRWGTEYVADRYSIHRVDNPKGVITAQDKLRKSNGEKGILILLFRWNISPTKRIEMARQRMRRI
ncbi:MAG: M48 family metalloprotease [Patescibacteria group bacterium]